MESNIKIEAPKYRLYEKSSYEPLLLECLNNIHYFIDLSGGGFSAPKSESNGECDAIGKNNYSIDFKCLISEDGAKNANETSLTREKLCPGVTSVTSSKASMRGTSSLTFPSIWGFSVSGCLHLNENSEIEIKGEANPRIMMNTIKSLNRTICMKKSLLYFVPNRFVIEKPHDIAIEFLRIRAEEALSIISTARISLSSGYDTYYALLMNSFEIVLFSDDFTYLGCVTLTSLDSWRYVVSM